MYYGNQNPQGWTPSYFGNVNQFGQVPNQNQPPKATNWLPPETIALLKKGVEQFNIGVTDEDIARGQCNHIDPATGQLAVIPDGDGSNGYTCPICGTHFNANNYTAEDVKNATDLILDILNTIKISYLSLDPSAARDYFQIIPFIEKIPKLFEVALNDVKRYEGLSGFVNNGASLNPFTAFNMMMAPGFMGGYQNPGYGYGQYGAPAPAPAPQAPMNGYAAPNPGFNPMYGQYGAPAPAPAPQAAPQMQYGPNVTPIQPATPGYQPQSQGFAMNPQGAAAPAPQPVNTNMPVQPGSPVTAAPDPTKAEVKVDTQFKK